VQGRLIHLRFLYASIKHPDTFFFDTASIGWIGIHIHPRWLPMQVEKRI